LQEGYIQQEDISLFPSPAFNFSEGLD